MRKPNLRHRCNKLKKLALLESNKNTKNLLMSVIDLVDATEHSIFPEFILNKMNEYQLRNALFNINSYSEKALSKALGVK